MLTSSRPLLGLCIGALVGFLVCHVWASSGGVIGCFLCLFSSLILSVGLHGIQEWVMGWGDGGILYAVCACGQGTLMCSAGVAVDQCFVRCLWLLGSGPRQRSFSSFGGVGSVQGGGWVWHGWAWTVSGWRWWRVWFYVCLYFCRMYELVSYKMGHVSLPAGGID